MYLYWSRPPVQSTRSFPQYPHISFHTSSVNVSPIQTAVIFKSKDNHHNFLYLLLVPLDKIRDCKIEKRKKCLKCLNQNSSEVHIQTWVIFRNQDSKMKIHVSHFKRLVSFYMENKRKILQFRKYGLDYERSKMPLMSHLKKHQMFGRPNFLPPPAYFLSTHQPHFFST